MVIGTLFLASVLASGPGLSVNEPGARVEAVETERAAGAPAPIDFDVDVMPIFTKAGCNSCHGASGGRGGFRLSLFGGNPAADYDAIVHDLEGRRINLAHPAESLLLAKPTGELHHGGGLRLDPEGEGAARLARWIDEGAQRTNQRSLQTLELSPAQPRVAEPGQSVRLRATATFDDGSQQDVTAWTVFTATDPGALEISEDGTATVLRRGRSVVLARYLTEIVPAIVTTPFGELAEKVSASEAQENFVDEHVDRLIGTLGLEAAGPVDDAGFLRRAHLALTGTLPTRKEVESFLGETNEGKRVRLVDALLDSDAFVDFWTYRFATLLRIRAVPKEDPVAKAYRGWLREAVATNAPFDEIVRTLLTASGDSHEFGPAGFYRMNEGPREDAEFVSESLLGARLRCANCHDHPLDRWTQDDYHGLAAAFARVERNRVVRDRDYGEVTHPATGEPALARLPGTRFVQDQNSARAELADWITTEASLPLARNLVNRLWSTVMGRGLVEPVDDVRVTNPPVNPELLDALARDFIASGYDLRHSLRVLTTSAVFARALPDPSAPSASATFGAGALERALDAEVLADAMAAVTGVADRYADVAEGTRAIALDPTTPSLGLDLLGRCAPEEPCGATSTTPGLAAVLHFVNGELVNGKISSRSGRLAEHLAAGSDNAAIVEDFYLRALGRYPTADESAFWTAELGAEPFSRAHLHALEDFLWSLLTCREFKTNH